MRRLIMIALFVLLSSSYVYGYNGSISLYTDATLTDCDGSTEWYEVDSVYVFYVRGQGPDLGREISFRLQLSSADVIFSPAPVWSPRITSTIGDIQTGITLQSGICIGMNEAVVTLGRVCVYFNADPWNSDPRAMFYLSVAAHPSSGMISIRACDPQETLVPVLGGTFVFNGSCNVAVKASSWGAIKSLYQ